MECQQLLIDVFEGILKTLEKALTGLTETELNNQPNADCNSIGWLTWHLTRTQDRAIANLTGKNQVWIENEWYKKFNRSADPGDTGFGHTSADVSSFKSPDVSILLDYYKAVFECSKIYLSGLTLSELGRKTEHPKFTTVGAWLGAILSDNLQHTGQIAYLRGLIKGKGWLGA